MYIEATVYPGGPLPEAAAYISCEVIIWSLQDILLPLTPYTSHTMLAALIYVPCERNGTTAYERLSRVFVLRASVTLHIELWNLNYASGQKKRGKL